MITASWHLIHRRMDGQTCLQYVQCRALQAWKLLCLPGESRQTQHMDGSSEHMVMRSMHHLPNPVASEPHVPAMD